MLKNNRCLVSTCMSEYLAHTESSLTNDSSFRTNLSHQTPRSHSNRDTNLHELVPYAFFMFNIQERIEEVTSTSVLHGAKTGLPSQCAELNGGRYKWRRKRKLPCLWRAQFLLWSIGGSTSITLTSSAYFPLTSKTLHQILVFVLALCTGMLKYKTLTN